jgi:hypothetical protein
MNKSPNGGCHFCKDPENLMHLFLTVNWWIVCGQKFSNKSRNFMNKMKLKLYQIRKFDNLILFPVLLLARENMNEISLLMKLIIFNLVIFSFGI